MEIFKKQINSVEKLFIAFFINSLIYVVLVPFKTIYILSNDFVFQETRKNPLFIYFSIDLKGIQSSTQCYKMF